MIEPMSDLSWLNSSQVRPLRRVEYDHLIETGIIGENERLELLYGFLVAKEPQGAPHAGGAQRLMKILILALGDRAEVRAHSPLAVSDHSEPEPDIAVVAPGDHRLAHPATALLVVEFAQTSLKIDRGPKAALYAAAGVPEYWVANLVERLVEIHDEPSGGIYRRMRTVGPDEHLSPKAFPDLVIDVRALVPDA